MFILTSQSISVVEPLASLSDKLEVAIYVGVVVMHVISLLLNCGGLHGDGELYEITVIGHLSVSTLLFSMYIYLYYA